MFLVLAATCQLILLFFLNLQPAGASVVAAPASKEQYSQRCCDLGARYENKKQFTLADNQYAQVISLWAAGNSAAAAEEKKYYYHLIGRRYLERGDFARAKPLIDVAVSLSRVLPPGLDDYSRGEILSTLATWHQRQRNWTEAEAAWLEATRYSNPDFQYCRLELFEVYFAAGKLEKAAVVLQEADRVMYNLRPELRMKHVKLLKAQHKHLEAFAVQTESGIKNILSRAWCDVERWSSNDPKWHDLFLQKAPFLFGGL